MGLGARIQRNSTKNLFYKTSNHRTLRKIHLVREFNGILQKNYSTKRQTIELYKKSTWCANPTEFYKKTYSTKRQTIELYEKSTRCTNSTEFYKKKLFYR